MLVSLKGSEQPVCARWGETVHWSPPLLAGRCAVVRPSPGTEAPVSLFYSSFPSNPYYWSLMRCVGKAKLSAVLGPVSEARVWKSGFGAEAMNDLTPLASPPRHHILKTEVFLCFFLLQET